MSITVLQGLPGFITTMNWNSVRDKKALYENEHIFDIYPEYYIIRVDKFNDLAKDTLDEWIYFLKNGEIEDEFKARGLKEASEKLRAMELPEKKEGNTKLPGDLHYQASMIESTYG